MTIRTLPSNTSLGEQRDGSPLVMALLEAHRVNLGTLYWALSTGRSSCPVVAVGHLAGRRAQSGQAGDRS